MWYVTVSKDRMTENLANNWQNLEIDGGNIRFFLEPILDHFKAYAQNRDDQRYWKISFFTNSPHQQDLFISFGPEPKATNSQVLFKAFWDELSGNEPNEDQVKKASLWLRGSESLRLSGYEQNAGRWIAIDGHGISMFSKSYEIKTFQRYIVLLALAATYRLSVEKMIGLLGDSKNQGSDLKNLVKQSYEFAAQYYFKHPVCPEHVELPFIWDKIRERMRIQEYFDEFLAQASAQYRIVVETERDAEQQRQEKTANLLTMILVVLGLLTIIEGFPVFIHALHLFGAHK